MVRYKNRYFVAEIEVCDIPRHAPMVFSNNRLKASILKMIHEIHGDFGLASVTAGFTIKYCNCYTKIVMIRGRHGPHRFIGTVLPLIKTVDNTRVLFNILYVGSTMMKSFKFIRNYQLALLENFWNNMKSEKDRIQLKEAILKVSSLKEQE